MMKLNHFKNSIRAFLCVQNVIFLRERLDYSAPNEEFIVYEDFPSKNEQASFAFLSFPEF